MDDVWILWVSSIALIMVCASVVLLITILKYLKHVGAQAAIEQAAAQVVAQAAKEEARMAYGEASVAHNRIDRLDADIRHDRREMRELREQQATIKGWVKFVMHRDLSDEIKKSTFANELNPDGKP